MSTGSSMEVDLSSLFVKTKSKHRPSTLDMIKAADVADINNLTADTSKAKRRCHCYAIITPALAEAV